MMKMQIMVLIVSMVNEIIEVVEDPLGVRRQDVLLQEPLQLSYWKTLELLS